ncbi:MAG: flagellar biosynthetic protein FliO [Massilia sp.]|nr:flagellar biosynthetic protein FliO [Massilia sp.]
MTARPLTILALRLVLSLPLAACATQPGPEPAASAPSTIGQDQAATQATPAPVQAPATTATPAAAGTQADIPRQNNTAAPNAQHGAGTAAPRRAAAAGQRTGNGAVAATPAAAPAAAPATTSATTPPASGAGTSVSGTSVSGTSTSDSSAAPATATPAAPDVAAPRPVTPGATVPPVTMPSGSSTGSLLQTLFALIVVLAVLGALAWFLKRYAPRVAGGNANLRVVGSLNLGGRERIVVVEVGNEWIVVGASPGRINALATMPRQDGQNGEGNTGANAALTPRAPAAHSFADWLKQTIDKRK